MANPVSNTTKNQMNDWSAVVVTDSGKTAKGTKIVRDTSNTLGEDAFVKILMAELAHQDPTSQQDSTQYIAQMAQFSAVQEMTNLNKTMTFYGASSLMGRYVVLNSIDSNGDPYQGHVEKVEKNGDNINVYVQLVSGKDGKPVYQEKVDKDGNVIKDKDGNVEYLTYQDTVTDASGKVTTVERKIPKVMEFNYSNVVSSTNIDSNVYDTTQGQEQMAADQAAKDAAAKAAEDAKNKAAGSGSTTTTT